MECSSEVIKIPKYLEAISFTSDGHLAITASSLTGTLWTGVIAIFSDPNLAPNIPHIDTSTETEAGCSDIRWVDKGRLAVCSDSGAVEVWSLVENGCIMENSMMLLEHDDVCCTMSIDPSLLQIASGSWDGKVKVWDLSVEMSVHTYAVNQDRVLSVSWNQLTPFIIASASEDGSVKLYDNRLVKPASFLCYDDTKYPCSLDWDPTVETAIAVGYIDGSIQITDTRHPKVPLTTYKEHSRNVNRLLFLKDRTGLIASISDDLTVNIQDYQGKLSVYKDNSHVDYVRGMAWNPSDKKLWTCAWDGKVLSHDIPGKGSSKENGLDNMEE